MWCTLLKYFKSPSFLNSSSEETKEGSHDEKMEKDQEDRRAVHQPMEISNVEDYDSHKAKQRASILWLIGKANNNKIPDELKDPYYKDHDEQDQLKPVVVHALASAEYYCLALGCIYADPNYHNLNHWGVIQALARKGVYVAEPSDVSLTETVLIQTSPIRLSAHMAVIEAIMSLYLKETVTIERIVNAVRRLVPTGGPIEMPSDIEEALIYWINKVCVKMKHRIEDEMNIGTPEVQKGKPDDSTLISNGKSKVDNGEMTSSEGKKEVSCLNICETQERRSESPDSKMVITQSEINREKSDNLAEKVAPQIPLLQDLGDLSDGCCLAAVVSYYCPLALHWQDICLNEPISMADSLYNLQLVQKFCRDHLSCDISFLTLEDLIYQHSSVRQNVLVFLAELFFTFEVRPAKCVRVYGPRPEVASPEAAGLVRKNGHYGLVSSATKRSFQQSVSPIPDLRNSASSFPDANRISPKGSASHREPLLPRRQSSQHERMQERSKRFSFTDGSKIGLSTSGDSMRRTHSMQDIDKNGAEKPYLDVSRTDNVRKGGRGRDDHYGPADGGELYLRPMPVTRDGEPLMPAIVRPAKEKTNFESKPEEMGEYPMRQSSAPPNHRSKTPNNRRGSTLQDDRDEKPYLSRQEEPNDNGRSKLLDHADGDFYSKSDATFTYVDNRELEEKLKAAAKYQKIPSLGLKSEDIARLKEGLENLGHGENSVFLDQDVHFKKDGGQYTTSFAQLSKPRDHQSGGINIVYMQHDADADGSRHPRKSSFLQRGRGDKGDKKTSFAALPNQTTWQQHQQGRNHSSQQIDSGHETPCEGLTPDAPLASQLYDVRLKLEEKKRHIEQEKRQMDLMMSRSRQKVGKAAFLQAVSRNKAASGVKTPDSGAGDEVDSLQDTVPPQGTNGTHEVGATTDALGGNGGPRYSPTQEEDYNRSMDQLSASLGNLQADIQRLTIQQKQIQQLMESGAQQQQPDPQGQFYLHDNPPPRSQESPSTTATWMAPVHQQHPQETLYQPAREPLYQGMQRSQSIEQLYQQPLNATQTMEPLYQPMRRSQSREQLYQPLPLQRTASREQLYQPPLQRTASREQLYQPQTLMHMTGPVSSGQMQWMHPMDGPRQAVMPPQHAYVDQQTGYIVHQQQPMHGYQLGPQYISIGSGAPPGMAMYPNGLSHQDQYGGHYGQYPQHLLNDGGQPGYGPPPPPHVQSSPYRLHIEVPGSGGPMGPPGALQQHHHHGPSSRSQSPMTFLHHLPQQQQLHQPPSQPSSRPPSRPPSVTAVPGVVGFQAPSKALPVTAPPESYMEPQLVHFIDVPSGVDATAHNHLDPDEQFSMEKARALASLDEAISGTGTYRVKEPMSPTRPTLGKTFRVAKPKVLSPPPPPPSSSSGLDNLEDYDYDDDGNEQLSPPPPVQQQLLGTNVTQPIKFGVTSDKGFFVSFDGEQPKRPKPPLRTKKVPKAATSKSEEVTPEREQAPEFPVMTYRQEQQQQPSAYYRMTTPPSSKAQAGQDSFKNLADSPGRVWKTPTKAFLMNEPSTGVSLLDEKGDSEPELVEPVEVIGTPKGDVGNIGLYIGSGLVSPNPVEEDEMARKKERILMSVIKRKEQQEAARAKKELEAAKQREHKRAQQEMLERKKEEERARRNAILEQYKQRKAAMEEQEGGEKGDGGKTSTLPKSKGKLMKPRPKSLHESALSAAEHRAAASRGSVVSSSGMRGSQNNLAGLGNEQSGYGSNYRYADTDSAYVSPPSLPPGLVSRRMGGLFSDTASDSCSTASSTVEYTGPKLFKQPTAKSNRGIIINAINTVLAGAVNGEPKRRVLEEITRSDSKHFLILFRDAGCQFRALYSYQPEKDEVFKLFGTGPKQVTLKMFDKFFKYNCGGRNFTEIQTKHLTVTIDAFTIQNNLWQVKRVVPSKKDYY